MFICVNDGLIATDRFFYSRATQLGESGQFLDAVWAPARPEVHQSVSARLHKCGEVLWNALLGLTLEKVPSVFFTMLIWGKGL